jgi:RNA polymerase sigma factor (sigma-70 family)
MEASRAAPPPRARTSLRQLALPRRPADRAFEQLYQRHAREVYQYALALTANPADAEDVTQTTFLNAYRAFQKGERPHKPHNWLITIAHNVCRMRWRQAGSRPNEVALEEAPEPVARDEEQPDLDEVLTALAALSFNQRAAIVMRELEGRSYQEISGVLGVSVSAVEALLFRARRNLQVSRRGLGVLTTVPLPGSLASFVGGGGGAVVAGSAIGADLVLKAAAVVAVGAATAGAGYRSVQALTAPRAAVSVAAVAPKPELDRAAAATRSPNRQGSSARVARPALRQAVASPGSSRASRPTGSSGSLPASDPTAAPPPPSVATPPALSTPQLPAPQLPTPQLPAPQLPPPPPVALPPVPPLPVTVPIPPLPPLPPAPPPIK